MRAALAEAERTGSDVARECTSLLNLAELYRLQQRYGEAKLHYERSRVVWEVTPTDKGAPYAQILQLQMLREFDECESLWAELLRAGEAKYGLDSPRILTDLTSLAGNHSLQRKFDLSEEEFQRAIQILRRTFGENHPATADGLRNLAFVLDIQGKYDKSERIYQQILGIRTHTLGPTDLSVADTLGYLAKGYRVRRRYSDVEAVLRQELTLYEKVFPPNHNRIRECYRDYANALADLGRTEEANRLRELNKRPQGGDK